MSGIEQQQRERLFALFAVSTFLSRPIHAFIQTSPITTSALTHSPSIPIVLPSAAGASLTDAESTIKADLLGICRAKPGEDSPYMSPEQVMNQVVRGRP